MRQTRRKRTLSNVTKEENHVIEKETEHDSKTRILEVDPSELSEEVAQNVWESLKEEFHASIEQLPLSFHRTFSLITEQDRESQACYAELFPTIRSYIKLRQSLQGCTGNTSAVDGSQKPVTDGASKPFSGSKFISTPTQTVDRRSSADITPYRHYHDNEPSTSPRRISRVRDATVPKSVPFPPRQKPRSTKELLVRLSFLLSEISNALEEKVGLANAAHDSALRHIKVLDAAIAEHDGPKLAVDAGVVLLSKSSSSTEDSGRLKREESGDADEGCHTEFAERYNEPLPRRLKRRTREGGVSASTSSDQPRPGASVDFIEERYCYCNQISYGEMVACDNPACEHEWFHLGCVGLSTLPSRRVKWYCPDCHTREQNKKRKGH